LQDTAEGRAQSVKEMLDAGGNIHYTHFTGGDHMNTWRVAYDIEGVKEWLFSQHK
jgi:predicted peptidase